MRLGDDIQRLRMDAGITRAELASAVGVHRSHIARIEVGQAHASLELVAAIGVALGAEASVRYFAGTGPRLHDRFQAPMIEGFLRHLDHRWLAEPEIPVGQPSRGVIDLVLTDRIGRTVIAAEAHSELRRLEQQIRWANEKADGLDRERRLRFGSVDTEIEVSRLLILRSTVATRDLARRFDATLASAYPARTTDAVAALTTADTRWPGAAIVWMALDRDGARLLPGPPRGVSLGR